MGEVVSFDTLLEELDRRIDAKLAPLTQPQGGLVVERIETVPAALPEKTGLDRGIGFARFATALAATKGNTREAAQWAAKHPHWGGERNEVALALGASSPTAGGTFVPSLYSQDWIELLRPESVIRQFGPRIYQTPNGNVTIPKLTGGATAAFAAENTATTASQQTTNQIVMIGKELRVIVPMSNALAQYSSPGMDQIVRDDMLAAAAEKEDQKFIRGDGLSDTPRGLRYWAPSANVTTSTSPGSVTISTVTTDLGWLYLKLRSNNVKFRKPGYLFSPRTERYLYDARDSDGKYVWRDEMNQGLLRKYPYKVTTLIPETLDGTANRTEVYFVDFSEAVISESISVQIDASNEAAYVDSSSTVQAAFSRNETVIRLVTACDFAMRHDFAVAVLTGVDWGV